MALVARSSCCSLKQHRFERGLFLPVAIQFIVIAGLAPQFLFTIPTFHHTAHRLRHSRRSCTQPFCGHAPLPARYPKQESQNIGLAHGAVATPWAWVNPKQWGDTQQTPSDRLSPREWQRMYRTLGINEDASREKVLKTAARLRKKYANDETALERIEAANLWIMTRIVSRKEETVRRRQQANRLRELGDSPRKLFQKYLLGYLPPNVRQMLEAPSMKQFRLASGLLGMCALIGLCVPTQATNVIGLGAACSMGCVFSRNRPEPVKDDMGNVGAVQKLNPKEVVATIILVVLAAGLGLGLAFAIDRFVTAPFAVIYSTCACLWYWLAALFFKVHECFD